MLNVHFLFASDLKVDLEEYSFWTHQTSVTPPLFIEVHVPVHEY